MFRKVGRPQGLRMRQEVVLSRVRQKDQGARGSVRREVQLGAQPRGQTHELLALCTLAGIKSMDGADMIQGQELVGMLDRMQQARAGSTVQKYTGAMNRVLEFAEQYGGAVMPLTPGMLLKYINNLTARCEKHGYTRSSVYTACAAVSYFHRGAGLPDPTEHELVRRLKHAASRILGKGGKQQTPLTGRDMQKLYEAQAGHGMDELVFLMQIAGMKDGLLRWDDACKVRFGDILVYTDHMRVFIWMSKTDQHRKGAWVIWNRSRDPWCAYNLFSRVIEHFSTVWDRMSAGAKQVWAGGRRGGTGWSARQGVAAVQTARLDDVPFLCRTATVAGGVIMPLPALVPYDVFVALFRAWLGGVGLRAEAYCTHSMRRGGATELYKQGTEVDIIMEQGRWRCQRTMRSYIGWEEGITQRVRRMQNGVLDAGASGGTAQSEETREEEEETMAALMSQALEFLEEMDGLERDGSESDSSG